MSEREDKFIINDKTSLHNEKLEHYNNDDSIIVTFGYDICPKGECSIFCLKEHKGMQFCEGFIKFKNLLSEDEFKWCNNLNKIIAFINDSIFDEKSALKFNVETISVGHMKVPITRVKYITIRNVIEEPFVRSNTKFAKAVGYMQGIVSLFLLRIQNQLHWWDYAGYPSFDYYFSFVQPQTWQKVMYSDFTNGKKWLPKELKREKLKKMSLDNLERLQPVFFKIHSKEIDDNVSDAFNIAYYGQYNFDGHSKF